jgi:hypothetical protein
VSHPALIAPLNAVIGNQRSEKSPFRRPARADRVLRPPPSFQSGRTGRPRSPFFESATIHSMVKVKTTAHFALYPGGAAACRCDPLMCETCVGQTYTIENLATYPLIQGGEFRPGGGMRDKRGCRGFLPAIWFVSVPAQVLQIARVPEDRPAPPRVQQRRLARQSPAASV